MLLRSCVRRTKRLTSSRLSDRGAEVDFPTLFKVCREKAACAQKGAKGLWKTKTLKQERCGNPAQLF